MGNEPHSQTSDDETRAIAACQRGDRSAYEILVKNYGSRAIGIARGILRDAALAEDMAQEAFVRAYRAIKRFDLNQPFYPWFYRILKNCCLSAGTASFARRQRIARGKRHHRFDGCAGTG